jgi:hypothetical protein
LVLVHAYTLDVEVEHRRTQSGSVQFASRSSKVRLFM